MKPEGRRGLASTAPLLFAILLSLTVGAAAPAQSPRLAALAATALLWRGLFAAGTLSEALAGFATALDLAVGLGLSLVAVGLTGGLKSELYPLLLVDLALAHGFLGPAAARFLAVGRCSVWAPSRAWPARPTPRPRGSRSGCA